MALDTVIATGVATAARILTRGRLLATVSHVPVTSVNDYAEPQPGTPVSRQALVEDGTVVLDGANGEQYLASAKVTLLGAVTVDPRDLFVLPGSSTQRQVLRVRRGVLAESGTHFVTEVWVA